MDENVIHELTHEINGFKVMPDFDLSKLYGVTTKALNQAMKRNPERFPQILVFNSQKHNGILCGHKL